MSLDPYVVVDAGKSVAVASFLLWLWSLGTLKFVYWHS